MKAQIPEGCVCDPDLWLVEDVPPVCEKFKKGAWFETECVNCPHEKGCHGRRRQGNER